MHRSLIPTHAGSIPAIPEYNNIIVDNMAYPRTKGTVIGDKAKRPHPGIPFNKDQVGRLIVDLGGNLSRVADTMGSNRGSLRAYIDRDADLKQLLADCRERHIDEIEQSVYQRAATGTDTGLQCFILKTQGRHRGWDQDDSKNSAKDIASAAFEFILDKSKNPADNGKS